MNRHLHICNFLHTMAIILCSPIWAFLSIFPFRIVSCMCFPRCPLWTFLGSFLRLHSLPSCGWATYYTLHPVLIIIHFQYENSFIKLCLQTVAKVTMIKWYLRYNAECLNEKHNPLSLRKSVIKTWPHLTAFKNNIVVAMRLLLWIGIHIPMLILSTWEILLHPPISKMRNFLFLCCPHLCPSPPDPLVIIFTFKISLHSVLQQ